MIAAICAALVVLVVVVLTIVAHARGRSAGWRAATDAHAARASEVEAGLARTDAASQARERADVAKIEAEGQAARATAGDNLGALINEARERGHR